MKNNQSSGGLAKRLLAMCIAIAFVATLMAPLISGGTAPIEIKSSEPVPVEEAGSGASQPTPDTIVVQPNVTVGKDTFIANIFVNPDQNFGDETFMSVGTDTSGTAIARGLVQFDIPSKAASLLRADLYLYANYNHNTSSGVNVTVYPITQPWTEGDGTNWNDATWNNRTTGVPWTTSGGDYSATYLAYQNVSVTSCWYGWNVTNIVSAWLTGTLQNYGFHLNGTPLGGSIENYVQFLTSDYTTNTNLTPKLILIYSAEIDPPLSAITMQEDEAMRTIPLDGMGDGTVTHISFPTQYVGLYPPFWGAGYDQLHIQMIYTSDQVGIEGTIRRISFDRGMGYSDIVGVFNNFNIKMAHTNLTTLTDTFANNYYGYLIEVFPTQTFFANSSNRDTAIHLDLNDNFTYDSRFNLLIDITWNGDGGVNVPVDYIGSTAKALYINTGAATGTVDDFLPVVKFWVDAVDNAVVDDGKGGFNLPFSTNINEGHHQILYNKTYLNQSGVVDKLGFQMWSSSPAYVILENFSIRMAHSTNDTLDANYTSHTATPWVEVFNKSSYNISGNSTPEWVIIDINNIFTYNGINNLLVDIRFYGVGNPGVMMFWCTNLTAGVNCCVYGTSYSASIGTAQEYRTNMQFIFLDSVNLTWSATSSNTSLFTASVSGRNLQITPVANAFGTGNISLILTNSNGLGVVQIVLVTISPVNDAPVLAGVPTAITCIEDVDYILNMTPYASDIDNDVSTLTYTTDSTFASVNGSLITFNYPEGITSQSVNITVHDAPGLTASAIVAVTIIPVNDAPHLANFDSLLTCDATIPKSITVNPTDEETPSASLTISVSSSYANVTNHTITFLYPKGIGSESVTVTVHDEQIYGNANSTSYILSVTILDHPDVVSHNPTGDAVAVDTYIVVEFDMAMNTTETEASFSLRLGATVINGTFAWTNNNTRLTFMPEDHLTNGLYDVRLGTGASSAAGITMLAPFAWNFTAVLGDFDGDDDQIPDQYELDNGLDPNTNDAAADTDNDGMPNLYEYQNNLDAGTNDAALDADGDGYTNLEEYDAGTNPQDPADKPFSFMLILIIIIIVVIVALLALVLLMKRKPKPSEGVQEYYPQPEGPQPPPPQPDQGQGPPQP
jgi:hypothetical protein